MLKPVNMALSLEILAFSPSGDYLAYSTSDGRLKLWETATGTLKQEYTPSSHLSSTCNCLAWSLPRQRSNSPRKKRKKLVQESADEVTTSNIIAMGTTSGSVLLYNMLEADLHTQLEKGHNDVVNDVCWNSNSQFLYSCSNDQHIVQWDVRKSTVKYKWKGDRHAIFSVHLVDEDNLLSASRSIKWWNLSTREVLKKFTGHATEIFRMLSVQFSDKQECEGTYFLSAAQNDRTISAWQLKKDSDVTGVATFGASEEIVHFDVSREQKTNEPVLLSAVSQIGVLHVYEHQLNGKCPKPLEPCVRVMLSTEGANGTHPKPIPIFASCVLGGHERRVLIAYGSLLRPVFEEIVIKECKAEEWLIRQDLASTASVDIQQSVSKVKSVDSSSVSTVLVPGFMAHVGHSQTNLKRKEKKVEQNQLPMEVRLNALTLGESKPKSVPTVNNLVHLLLQGLQSNNTELLNRVLYKTNDSAVNNTVQRLPLTAIVPLVKELHKRLHGRGQGCHSYVKWMKSILFTHNSYLMSCPEMDSLLGPMSQLLDARVEAFPKLSQLRGKLNFLLTQITTATNSTSFGEPLLIHHESSDDESIDNVEEDLLPRLSESEDDWSDEMEEEDPVLDRDRTSSSEED